MKNFKNEAADIGVSTLIIFTAMVLVAGVAAAMLIYTTGSLQQKADRTSADAAKQISSNLVVERVIGDRVNSTVSGNQPGIQGLLIYIKPNVGTVSIDLSQVIITERTGSSIDYLSYSNKSGIPGTFGIVPIRDEDGSASEHILNRGDSFEIKFYTMNYTSPILLPRQTMSLSIDQVLGGSVNLELTAPDSFGTGRYVKIYP